MHIKLFAIVGLGGACFHAIAGELFAQNEQEGSAVIAEEAQEIHEVTYKNKKAGYIIKYPGDWVLNGDIEGFDLFIMAPRNEAGQSMANLSIISGELPDTIDLETYYKENLKTLLFNNSGIHIKESGKTTFDGVPTRWVHYTRADDHTEIVHYFFLINGYGVLITCGSIEDEYAHYADSFKKIVDSFTLIH